MTWHILYAVFWFTGIEMCFFKNNTADFLVKEFLNP